MKKALAFLLAFALVGAFVFAQDEAPAANGLVDLFTKAPVVTYGVDGGLDYMFDGTLVNTYGSDGYITLKELTNTNSVYFYSTPWIKFAYGNLSFNFKYYWDPANYYVMPSVGTYGASGYGEFNEFAATVNMASLAVGYKFDKLSITSTTFYDIENTIADSMSGNTHSAIGGYDAGSFNVYTWSLDVYNQFYQTNSVSMSADNISATFATLTAFGVDQDGGFYAPTMVTDASFTISNIFDVLKIKIGGSGSNYIRIMSLFGGAPYYNLFASQSTVGRIRERITNGSVGDLTTVIAMSTTNLPFISTISLKDKLSLPLTVYLSTTIPYAATTTAPAYLNSKLATLAVKYDLEGIGSFDLGWNMGIGADLGYQPAGPVWVKNARLLDQNTFFLDAKINMEALSALTVLLGVDFYLGQFSSTDGITGVGTLADPMVMNYIAENKLSLGLEAQYDFADMIEGLSVDFALYIKSYTGQTYDNITAGTNTFAQYLDATYPTATWFRMPTMTEANYVYYILPASGKLNPLGFMLQVNYALNDTFSFYLRNQYVQNAGSFVATSTNFTTAALRPVGVYSTNKIVLNSDIVQGAATISFMFSYTMALGMPTAANLGYTDAIAQANGFKTAADIYKDEAPSVVTNPWGLNIIYSLSF